MHTTLSESAYSLKHWRIIQKQHSVLSTRFVSFVVATIHCISLSPCKTLWPNQH